MLSAGSSLKSQAIERITKGQRYAKTAELVVSALALGVLAFFYVLHIGQALIFNRKLSDFVFYLTFGLLLAPACAMWLSSLTRSGRYSQLIRWHVWLAVLTMALLIAGAILRPILALGGLDLASYAKIIIVIVACCNAGSIVWISRGNRTSSQQLNPARNEIKEPPFPILLFTGIFFSALIIFFTIDPQRGLLQWIPFAAGLPFQPTGLGSFGSVMVGLIIVTFASILAELEIRLRTRPSSLARMRRLSLAIAILLVPFLFFDVSLPTEALHYLTNIAPAAQLQHGGVLLVDTFSQYGPGPVIATLVGFELFGNSFGAAGLTVQIFNLLFYALWLVCLYRASPLRMAALVLGLGLIGTLIAVWGLGSSNINFAPSILGFRYLPILLMVLAISCLPPQSFRSLWTGVAMFLAALWSIETLAGAVFVHVSFAGLHITRNRSWNRLVPTAIEVILPAIAAIGVFCFYTLTVAGSLPNYPTYLGYLTTYNFLSKLWSLPANAAFFGWLPIFIAIFLCMFDAWRRVLEPHTSIFAVSSAVLFYKFVPMALMCFVMASYYAGRSVDYVIILALLPFGALVVPALGWIFEVNRTSQSKAASGLLMISAALLILGFGFAVAALSRPDGQYRLPMNECFDRGNCSISSLLKALDARLNKRPVLDKVGTSYGDAYYDASGTVRDAVRLLNHPDFGQRAVVLVGSVRDQPILDNLYDQVASDASLFYAEKWHLWPRSDTFVDELLPQRVEQILSAPIDLEEQSLILVRRDETRLGKIEAGILALIRAQFTLCELQYSTMRVVVYRLTRSSACNAGGL